MKKFNLINLKTKEQHICKKVVVDGFDYYVSDEDTPVGSLYYSVATNTIHTMGMETKDNESFDLSIRKLHFKVITTNNPNIDLPQIVDEVEMLAKKDANLVWCDKSTPENEQREFNGHVTGFIEGYNKSQETHPNSDEDMIDFAIWLNDTVFATYQVAGKYVGMWHIHYPNFTYITSNELIELFKEQQIKTVYYE